jgi:hypothetical protein
MGSFKVPWIEEKGRDKVLPVSASRKYKPGANDAVIHAGVLVSQILPPFVGEKFALRFSRGHRDEGFGF